jgi:gamma-glutamylcyclotransferase (GGCT)/AIG2-like uncharacterized protein YtfP
VRIEKHASDVSGLPTPAPSVPRCDRCEHASEERHGRAGHTAGWGAELGYPGLILDAHGPLVEVDVFESSALPEHWHRLDAFEGPGYHRVAIDVTTAEGALAASIYVLAETIRRA